MTYDSVHKSKIPLMLSLLALKTHTYTVKKQEDVHCFRHITYYCRVLPVCDHFIYELLRRYLTFLSCFHAISSSQRNKRAKSRRACVTAFDPSALKQKCISIKNLYKTDKNTDALVRASNDVRLRRTTQKTKYISIYHNQNAKQSYTINITHKYLKNVAKLKYL